MLPATDDECREFLAHIRRIKPKPPTEWKRTDVQFTIQIKGKLIIDSRLSGMQALLIEHMLISVDY